MTKPTLVTCARDSYDSEFRGLINKPNPDGSIWVDALEQYSRCVNDAVLSAARVIYRNYNVNQIPHVVGFLWSEITDDCSNHLMIEVQYDKCGWRAVYGGRITKTGFKWQCYMD